jgi:arabinofuranan 3-O-arabinosyltransferase
VAAASGSDPAGAVYAFSRSPHADGCIDIAAAPACASWLVRGGEDLDALDRTFATSATEDVGILGTVLPKESPELETLLQKASPLKVSASSQLVDDPRDRAAQVFAPSGGGPWIAGSLDTEPRITVSWKGKRKLTELDLTPASDKVASMPRSVLLTSPAGTRRATVPPDGVIRFAALTTDTVTVGFPDVRTVTAEAPGGVQTPLPVGVARLRFPALDDLVRPVDAGAALPSECGAGPAVQIDDGSPLATRVVGSVGEAIDGSPLTLQLCDAKPVHLTPGSHRIHVADTAAWSAQTLDLAPAAASGASAAPGAEGTATRSESVVSWTATTKTVRVGPGQDWLLVMHQNANAGWHAELDGKVLKPVTVDGWEQAWLVPAGAGGVVRITYPPDRVYRAGLALGAVAALALVAVACVPGRRRGWHRHGDGPRGPGSVGFVGSVGPVGVGVVGNASSDSAIAAGVLTGVALVALGPAALIAVATWSLLVRTPRLAAPIAGGAFGLAGVWAAWQTYQGSASLSAADGRFVTVLCLVAVGAVAAGVQLKPDGGNV